MGPLVQFVILLIQVFPSALKAIQAWQDYHGQKLNGEHRQRIATDIKNIDLSTVLKNLGKPPATPQTEGAPNSQNPS